jgi:predicted kinase
MKTTKKLYLMCGLAFSGKSTLAREIGRRTGAQIISLDEINAERGLYGGQGVPDYEWAVTHQIALQRVAAAAREGLDAIIDDTNCFRWLRENYRKAVTPFGYVTTIIFLDVPMETIRKRSSANNLKPTRGDVLPDVMQELAGKFEYPIKEEEQTLIYSPDQPLDEWLEYNFP